MLTKNDLSAIQKIVKAETHGLDSKIDKVQASLASRIDGLDSKIDKVQESVDIIQGIVVKHYGKLEKRVERIEDHLDLSPIS